MPLGLYVEAAATYLAQTHDPQPELKLRELFVSRRQPHVPDTRLANFTMSDGSANYFFYEEFMVHYKNLSGEKEQKNFKSALQDVRLKHPDLYPVFLALFAQKFDQNLDYWQDHRVGSAAQVWQSEFYRWLQTELAAHPYPLSGQWPMPD